MQRRQPPTSTALLIALTTSLFVASCQTAQPPPTPDAVEPVTVREVTRVVTREVSVTVERVETKFVTPTPSPTPNPFPRIRADIEKTRATVRGNTSNLIDLAWIGRLSPNGRWMANARVLTETATAVTIDTSTVVTTGLFLELEPVGAGIALTQSIALRDGDSFALMGWSPTSNALAIAICSEPFREKMFDTHCVVADRLVLVRIDKKTNRISHTLTNQSEFLATSLRRTELVHRRRVASTDWLEQYSGNG